MNGPGLGCCGAEVDSLIPITPRSTLTYTGKYPNILLTETNDHVRGLLYADRT